MNQAKQSIRIIGGQWRSRQLPVLNEACCRPTPNRVRETLFNWLATKIAGARTLDCFAGSGALSFEALSRGAHSAVMIESSPALINQLHENCQTLQCHNAQIVSGRVPDLTLKPEAPFTIVFLDPPFHQGLLHDTFAWLIDQKLLAPRALIYVESEALLDEAQLPDGWMILKAKKAGAVAYHLIEI